jgi:hypothetical protein
MTTPYPQSRQPQHGQQHGGQQYAGQPQPGPAQPGPHPSGQPRPAAATRSRTARPTAARKRRVSGPTRAYVAMWAGMAGLAVTYLAVLTVKPDILTAMGAPMIPADPDSHQGQRLTAKLVAEVQTLQQTVSDLQGEVSSLRTNGAITVKAAARSTDIQEPRAPEPKLQGRLVVPDGTRLDGTRVAGMVIVNPGAPQPASDPVVGMGGRTVTTTMILPQGGSAPAQPTAPPAGPYGLELVTGPSIDALRLNWTLLGDRHGSALKSLEARYVAGEPSGVLKLLAGPVATAEEGHKLCEQFRAKGTPCRVALFQGTGF